MADRIVTMLSLLGLYPSVGFAYICRGKQVIPAPNYDTTIVALANSFITALLNHCQAQIFGRVCVRHRQANEQDRYRGSFNVSQDRT